jgi:hypothetical protein
MKILVVGDSFAADWTVKYFGTGWPNLLALDHSVTNLAQAGVGEYKILRQVRSVKNIEQFDLIIVSHTSPYRVNTRQHPVHDTDPLHRHADLMFADIEYHLKRFSNKLNQGLRTAFNFFVHHYDDEYQETVYELLRQEINNAIGTVPCIVVSNLNIEPRFVNESFVVDLTQIQQDYPGLINHLSEVGNQLAYKKIVEAIETR